MRGEQNGRFSPFKEKRKCVSYIAKTYREKEIEGRNFE